MGDMKTGGQTIVQELAAVMERIDSGECEALCGAILAARRIFLAGAGRSGLVVRAFAMRLMHLGLAAYVCGETTTPGAAEGDLLLIVSGSGETGGLPAAAKKAKSMGCRLALITVRRQSTIGELADYLVQVPAPTPKAEHGFRSIQPMGALFEQSCLLLLDAAVMRLMEQMDVDEAAMYARHANLE